jgi:hypothetical protein
MQVILACKDTTRNIRWASLIRFQGVKIGKCGSDLVSDLSPLRLRSYMSVGL